MTNRDLEGQLLDQEASQTLAWLKAVVKGEEKATKDFNWLGFAEAATDRAVAYGTQNQYDLVWAQVAILAYEYPEWKKDLGWDEDSYVAGAMSIRAIALGSGPIPDPAPC